MADEILAELTIKQKCVSFVSFSRYFTAKTAKPIEICQVWQHPASDKTDFHL